MYYNIMNDIINKFNEISIDFLSQTSKLVGTKYLFKYKLVTRINSVYAIDIFIKRILPHKEQIHARDENFFLEKSNDSEFNEYMNDITGIKTIYFTLDVQSKQSIWEILTALVYLAEQRHNHINLKKNIAISN